MPEPTSRSIARNHVRHDRANRYIGPPPTEVVLLRFLTEETSQHILGIPSRLGLRPTCLVRRNRLEQEWRAEQAIRQSPGKLGDTRFVFAVGHL